MLIVITFFAFSSLAASEKSSDKVTFRNVAISTLHEHLATIKEANSLKDYIPKNDTFPSIIVTGEIPILHENSVSDIENVEELRFLKNGIQEIEAGAFKNLEGMKSLIVSHSKLANINGSFNGTPLKELRINFNPLLKIDRNSFGNLSQLLVLDLRSNEIESIEEHTFDDLVNLEILDLSKNSISNLPINVFQNLKILLLQNNKIDQIEVIGPSVEEIDLNNNRLSTLSSVFANMTNLRKIIAAFNQISHIPNGVFIGTNLNQIELNNNRISLIDSEAFDHMPTLNKLTLSSNKITKYDPDWFKNSPNISSLYLSDNDMREIPDEDFGKLFKANVTYLDGNPLSAYSLARIGKWSVANPGRVELNKH